MKILVVNGSPNGANGNTQVLVDAFLEGAGEQGAVYEQVFLRDKKISPCIGCYSCWTKTPGKCIHNDDMPELLEKMNNSDMVVYATPLYVFTVTGIMKNFMDRVIPNVEPFIVMRNGLCTHPIRNKDSKWESAVLISNCGFPETEHFSGLKETMRCFLRDRLKGMICCAGGPLLKVPEMHDRVEQYLASVRQAGMDVVQDGGISTGAQAEIDRPLCDDAAMYADRANLIFKGLIKG